MTQFQRHFTLDEANALLPWVRSVLAKARRIIQSVEQPAPPAAPPPAGPKGNGGNGGTKSPPEDGTAEVIAVDEVWTDLSREERVRLVNGLLRALIDEGVVLQDVGRSLIDFPALRPDGVEFLYCYEESDGDRIGYWHHLDAGYVGRRPLAELEGDIP